MCLTLRMGSVTLLSLLCSPAFMLSPPRTAFEDRPTGTSAWARLDASVAVQPECPTPGLLSGDVRLTNSPPDEQLERDLDNTVQQMQCVFMM